MKNLDTRKRIILLVVIAALPTLALIVYGTLDQRAQAEMHAREDLSTLVKLAAQEQAQIIEATKQTLVAVSLAPSWMHNDARNCNAYLAKLLAKTSGIYHSMGIYGADGVLFCNAIPWQGRVYSPDRLYFQLARDTGKFAVGEYQIGRVTKQQGINFGYPLKDSAGTVTGVAFLALDLGGFNRMAAATPLPKDGVIIVVDREGVVLTRHPAKAELIGQKLKLAAVARQLSGNRSGVFEAADTTGHQRLYAHEVIAENPDSSIALRAIVSLPLSVVYADANSLLVRNLAYAVLATILLLVGAWYGAEVFLLRNIKKLLDAAKRVEAGNLSARAGLAAGKDEVAQLGSAFDAMAQALQNRDAELQRALHEMREQAVTDPLSGLYNRRFLHDALPRELTRARRRKSPVAVMMIDIDHFKRVNDLYGHEAGDLAIKAIAQAIKGAVRDSDHTCRYGGEEFSVVLPEAPAEGACVRAEAIRTAVRAMDIKCPGNRQIKVTVSIGIAMFPADGDSAETLLRDADEALYEAKGAGRDRVIMYAVTKAAAGGHPHHDRESCAA